MVPIVWIYNKVCWMVYVNWLYLITARSFDKSLFDDPLYNIIWAHSNSGNEWGGNFASFYQAAGVNC